MPVAKQQSSKLDIYSSKGFYLTRGRREAESQIIRHEGGIITRNSHERKGRNKITKIPLFLLLVSFLFVAVIIIMRGRNEGRNFLLITLDTVRADRLSCYGYGNISTANIDFLARSGVIFENAVSPAPLTLPSHTTLLTGLYPNVHGVRDNSSYKLSEKAITLAEILRSNGYATGAVVGSFILDSGFGLDQGFGYYDDEMVSSPVTSGTPSQESNRPVLKKLTPRPASAVTSRALSWLHRNMDKRFFLWIHYYDPHYPYNPPPPYSKEYRENPYDGEIVYVDQNVKAITEELMKNALLDKTLVVIAGDHGESLGEHGEQTHSVFIYESTIKVPLIMRYPGKLPAGIRINAPVSLADVVPTVLDILGIRSQADFNGSSLIDVIHNRSKEDRYIYSESLFSYLTYGWSQIMSIRDSRWKYIRSTDPELYDLSDDPLEKNNLIGTEEEVAEMLGERLDSMVSSTSLENMSLAEDINLSAEDRERLTALGYVTAGSISEEDASLRDPKEMIRFHTLIDGGNKAIDELRYDDAFKAFSEVIAMSEGYDADPNLMKMLGMVHNRMGIIYINRQDTTKAGIEFKKAVELDPGLLDAYHNLGNIHMMNKNYPEAAACFQRAVEIDPDVPGYYITLAKIYTQMGDTHRAQEAYNKAVRLGQPRR